MVAGIGKFFVARKNYVKFVDNHNAAEVGHTLLVKILPHHRAHEQHFCLAVVYDVVNIIGLEFVQNRYCYRAVCNNGKERNAPVGVVSSTDGDFVAFFDASLCKNDVNLFDSAGYILIL